MRANTGVTIINTVVISCFIICVTMAAIHFNKVGILWWYILAPFLMVHTDVVKIDQKEDDHG